MSEAARKRPECAWFRVAWPESSGSYIRGGSSGVADRPYGNLEKSSVMQNKEKVYFSRKLKGKKKVCVSALGDRSRQETCLVPLPLSTPGARPVENATSPGFHYGPAETTIWNYVNWDQRKSDKKEK